MKPINLNKEGCDPVSSNCVVWQGPDIECIDLCKGDSVTEVIFKLSTELCALMDTFNISNFDIECLDLGECGPTDFTGLFNILIQNICDLNQINPPVDFTTIVDSGDAKARSADGLLILPINPMFYFTDELGNEVTTMPLDQYVIAIGNAFALSVDTIRINTAALVEHGLRITALEDAPEPVLELPYLIPTCIGDDCVFPTPLSLDDFAKILEESFCALQKATGTPEMIFDALQNQCPGIGATDRLVGTGLVRDIPGWDLTPGTLASFMSNQALLLCDTRAGIALLMANLPTGCALIEIMVHSVILGSGKLRLTFTGSIPSYFDDDEGGSTIILTDNVGNEQVINNVRIKADHIITGTPLEINLDLISPMSTIYTNVQARFKNPTDGSTCESLAQSTALSADLCPTVTMTATPTSITGNFSYSGDVPTTLRVELYDVTETTLLQSMNLSMTSNLGNFIFNGLDPNTTYKTRVVINTIPCLFTTTSTIGYGCTGPMVSAPIVDTVDPFGDTTGGTIGAWIIEYLSFHP